MNRRFADPAFSATLRLVRPDRFDLEAVATSHGWYRLAPFEWEPSIGVLRYTGATDEHLVRLELVQAESHIEVTVDRVMSEETLVAWCRRMLQLDVDLAEFHSLCGTTPGWEDIPELRLGRLLCAPTLFEDAVKIILTTNTRWARTVAMNRRLVDCFGPTDGTLTSFPTPDALAATSEAALRDRAGLGYRARSVYKLACMFTSGEINPLSRPDPAGDYDELYEWYLQLPGIGPYGAAHLMAMDGRHDRIAVDTEFRAWVRAKYHGGRDVKDQTLLRHYRHWGPWKYIAYWCEMRMG